MTLPSVTGVARPKRPLAAWRLLCALATAACVGLTVGAPLAVAAHGHLDSDALASWGDDEDAFAALRAQAGFSGSGSVLSADALSAALAVSVAALVLVLAAGAGAGLAWSPRAAAAWSAWSLRGVRALLLASSVVNACSLQRLLWSRFRHAPLGRSLSGATQPMPRADPARREALLPLSARRTLAEVESMDTQALAWSRQMAAAEWMVAAAVTAHAIHALRRAYDQYAAAAAASHDRSKAPAAVPLPGSPSPAAAAGLHRAVLRVVGEWLASCWLLAFIGPEVALALFVVARAQAHAHTQAVHPSASIHPIDSCCDAQGQEDSATSRAKLQQKPSLPHAAGGAPLLSLLLPSPSVYRLLRVLTHPLLHYACFLAAMAWQAFLAWSLLLASQSDSTPSHTPPPLAAWLSFWWQAWVSHNSVLAYHARATALVLVLVISHLLGLAMQQRRPPSPAAWTALVLLLALAAHAPLVGLLGLLAWLVWTARVFQHTWPFSAHAPAAAFPPASAAADAPEGSSFRSDPLVSLCHASLGFALASQFVVVLVAHELEPSLNAVARHLLMAVLTAASHRFLFGATRRYLLRERDGDDGDSIAGAAPPPRQLEQLLSFRLRWPIGRAMSALLLAVYAIVVVLRCRAADYPLPLSWAHNNLLEALDEVLLPTSLLPLPPMGHADTMYAELWAMGVAMPLWVALRLMREAALGCSARCRRTGHIVSGDGVASDCLVAPATGAPPPARAASLLSCLLLLALVSFGSGPLVAERWQRRDCRLGPGEEDASMRLTPMQEEALRQSVERMATRLQTNDAVAAAAASGVGEHSGEAPPVVPGSGGRRSQHEKSHGCLHGELHVERFIPPQFRHGIFDPSRAAGNDSRSAYQALLRFSQGGFDPQSDSAINVRGLALKLLNVPGEKVLSSSELVASGAEEEADSQDFLLVTSPTFFASDARDMAELMDALLSPHARLWSMLRFLLPSWRPDSWRLHVLTGVARMLWTGGFERSLLGATYFSAVPSRLGPRTSAVKYQLIPVPCEEADARLEAQWAAAEESAAERSAASEADGAHNFLREGLSRRLDPDVGAGWDACFALRVQPQRDSCRNRLEDAQTAWQGEWAQLATLRIPKQRVEDAAREAQCAQRSFHPWHALVEHRPLGAIQNARRVAYVAAVQRRRKDAGSNSTGNGTRSDALAAAAAPPAPSPVLTHKHLFRHGVVDASLLSAESRSLERDAAGDVASYVFRRDVGAAEEEAAAGAGGHGASASDSGVSVPVMPSSLSELPWWEGWSWRHWFVFIGHSLYFQASSWFLSLTSQSQPLVQRLTDYRRIFQPLDARAWLNVTAVPHFPPPLTGSFERWRDDEFFAQQFLTGPVPDLIVRCSCSDSDSASGIGIAGQLACLPAHVALTLDKDPQRALDIAGDLQAADPDEPARTLVDLARASRLYVVDLSDVLGDVVTRPGAVLYAPVVVLYAHHGTRRLRPLLIQLESVQGARWYSPSTLSPRTAPWVWHFAKMHALHALGNYGGMVSHLLLAHLALEPIIIAFHRQVSAGHPLRALLADHFESTFAVNQLGRRTLLNTHHPWFDHVFSLGLHGAMRLMRTHAHRHSFLQSDFATSMRRRGFHEYAQPEPKSDHIADDDDDDDDDVDEGSAERIGEEQPGGAQAARGMDGVSSSRPNHTDSTAPPLLARYFYAEDGRLLRAGLSRLLWSVLRRPDVYGATRSADGSRVLQSSSAKIAADRELHAWLRESALTSVSGVSSGGASGGAAPIRSLRSLHSLLLHLVFSCSAQHAAVSLVQYESYAFPPFWPLLLTRAMPADQAAEQAFGERHVVQALASYRQMRETLLMMAVLSRPPLQGRDLCRGQCDATTIQLEEADLDACAEGIRRTHSHSHLTNGTTGAALSSCNHHPRAATSASATPSVGHDSSVPLSAASSPYFRELGAFTAEMRSLQCALVRRNRALGPDAYRALLPSQVALSVEA